MGIGRLKGPSVPSGMNRQKSSPSSASWRVWVVTESQDGGVLYFHLTCYRTWEAERNRL